MLIPIILSGGAGKRLWPVSRLLHPKPFIELEGESLLQKSLIRAQQLRGVREVLTVTTRELHYKTRDAYRSVRQPGPTLGYLLEPEGRNTAPAAAAAALVCARRHPGSTLLFLTADHLIEDVAAFGAAVEKARTLAADQVVTFGLRPDRPDTGYGYIQADGNRVKRFVEKPNLETAERYLAEGTYLWNSGMICVRAEVLLEELAQHTPELLAQQRRALGAATVGGNDADYDIELRADAYQDVQSISIDHALLEKTSRAAVVACDLGWTDVGTWSTLARQLPADAEGNRVRGEVLLHGTRDCYVHATDRLIAAVGVQGLIIVDTPDALLVMDASHAELIEQIIERLTAQGHASRLQHRTVHRPWGTYTVLETGIGFKIKRLCVNPGASLSLQMHHHRSEHWIVVDGTARITNGAEVSTIERNQSTYIPAGTVHKLGNPTAAPLVLIEVQSGPYLEEDDIVRFDEAAPGDTPVQQP